MEQPTGDTARNMPPAPIRVLICDDHPIVRDGLRLLLDGVDDIDVVETASDGEEGVRAAARLRPDVVLMDLAMPTVDGVAATRRITAELSDTHVVVLTSFAGHARVLEAIDAGAIGYLLKDAEAIDVIRAVRAAAVGDSPLDPRAARAVVSRTAADPLDGMTAREREVLALLSAGLPNKLIARRLDITETTVKAHLTRIYRHLGVDDRTQAALWAKEHDRAQG
jgi:DNA-binding NarL/FixJ family response regulator